MKCHITIAIIVSLLTIVTGLYTGDYISLGKPCDPALQNNGMANSEEWSGKVCFPGSRCDHQLKICDCSDSNDKKWKRTFENGECKLLPGSVCLPGVQDQSYYKCVNNSKCKVIRQGEDVSKCPADAPCDSGDAQCICNNEPGKENECLTHKVKASPI